MEMALGQEAVADTPRGVQPLHEPVPGPQRIWGTVEPLEDAGAVIEADRVVREALVEPVVHFERPLERPLELEDRREAVGRLHGQIAPLPPDRIDPRDRAGAPSLEEEAQFPALPVVVKGHRQVGIDEAGVEPRGPLHVTQAA